MDGKAHFLLEGRDQLLGGVGLQEARHILDAEGVGAPLFQLLGKVHVVLQGVLIPLGVGDVAGVAHGGLAELALL